MKEFYIKLTTLTLIILCFSIIIFCSIYFGISGTYENSYQKGFVYQYRALQNADPTESKIIVLGSSYMTFATDSTELSELTDMPVYTLGIHNGMGMDYIIETAEKFANSGDIIVFSFMPYEADEYGMPLIYLSLDSEPDMFLDFWKMHPEEVLRSAGDAIYTKLYGLNLYLKTKDALISSVYDARAFDSKTGNLIYERDRCVVEPKTLDYTDELSRNKVTDECAERIRTFSAYCKENNIAYYMLYAPFYPGAYGYPSESEIFDYQREIEQQLDTKFIVDMKECIVPLDYVYDAATHMNDYGKRYYTYLIYEGLSRYVTFQEME